MEQRQPLHRENCSSFPTAWVQTGLCKTQVLPHLPDPEDGNRGLQNHSQSYTPGLSWDCLTYEHTHDQKRVGWG